MWTIDKELSVTTSLFISYIQEILYTIVSFCKISQKGT